MFRSTGVRFFVLSAILLISGATFSADEQEFPATLRGAIVQGGLVFGKTKPSNEVYLEGESVAMDADGNFLLGFGRDSEGERNLRIVLPNGESLQKTLSIESREFDIQRIDGLPSKQVTPDPEVLDRIRAEAARVAEARQRRDQRQDFLSDFIWPAKGPISGVYGSQRILNGQPRNPHYGVDVAGPEGDPVTAPAPGIITLAEPDLYFSGGTVILDHGMGLSSTFLHLSSIDVEIGDRLKAGDKIGEIGQTGRATGPHLDWRMNLGAIRIDPQLIVSGSPEE